MSSRNFWLICLKTLGMWLIINLFISLPNMIYNLIALFTTPDSGMNVTIGISNAVFVSVIYFLIFQFLILRSHRTIDFLKLDKAFEGILQQITKNCHFTYWRSTACQFNSKPG
jgi:hypothetical protein